MAQTAALDAVVVFRSNFRRRAKLIADMLDARGVAVKVDQNADGDQQVLVTNAQAPIARELLMCYGLTAELN